MSHVTVLCLSVQFVLEPVPYYNPQQVFNAVITNSISYIHE